MGELGLEWEDMESSLGPFVASGTGQSVSTGAEFTDNSL